MADQDDLSPEKAASLNRHAAAHERLMHERQAAGTAAAAPHLTKKYHRSHAELLASAQQDITAGADPHATLATAAQAARELTRGRDLGVIAAGHATRQAHHDVAQAQRERGELTPGSRMALERNAAADAEFQKAIGEGMSDAQAQARADAAAEAIAAQQETAGGPLDLDQEGA